MNASAGVLKRRRAADYRSTMMAMLMMHAAGTRRDLCRITTVDDRR